MRILAIVMILTLSSCMVSKKVYDKKCCEVDELKAQVDELKALKDTTKVIEQLPNK